MSVLKSTNSGRSNVKLDVKYLRSKGWYYRSPSDSAGVDYSKIWRDSNHYLRIVDLWSGNGENRLLYYYEEIGEWVYNFTIITLSDLDDLEEFWKNKDIDFDKAEAKLVKEHPGIKSVNVIKIQTQKMTDELTHSIDKRIIDKIKASYNYPSYNTSYDYNFVKDRAARIAARII
jgi:hypothetical protein